MKRKLMSNAMERLSLLGGLARMMGCAAVIADVVV
jgi:hypothetical protein